MSLLAAALDRLVSAYPKQPFGDKAIVVYAEQLADLPEQHVYDAIWRLTNTEVRCPTIAEIRREVVEGMLGLPSPEEAWEMILRCVELPEGQILDGIPPEVKRSLKAVGGMWSVRHGNNVETLRAQFRKHYEGVRAKAVRNAAVGTPIRPEQLRGPRPPELPPAGGIVEAADRMAEVASIAARKLREIPESASIRPRRGGSGVRPAPLE